MYADLSMSIKRSEQCHDTQIFLYHRNYTWLRMRDNGNDEQRYPRYTLLISKVNSTIPHKIVWPILDENDILPIGVRSSVLRPKALHCSCERSHILDLTTLTGSSPIKTGGSIMIRHFTRLLYLSARRTFAGKCTPSNEVVDLYTATAALLQTF